jgi:hypothetical protein
LELTGFWGVTCRSRSRNQRCFSASLSLRNVGVFASQHKLLFAAVRSEAKVIDPLFVVLRLAFDHCVLRLEATIGLENGRAVGLPAIGSGDADVQRCGAVCHEAPLNPILRNKGPLHDF